MEVSLPLLQFMTLGIIIVEIIPLMWLLPRQKVEFCLYNEVCVCVLYIKFVLPKYFVHSHTGSKVGWTQARLPGYKASTVKYDSIYKLHEWSGTLSFHSQMYLVNKNFLSLSFFFVHVCVFKSYWNPSWFTILNEFSTLTSRKSVASMI